MKITTTSTRAVWPPCAGPEAALRRDRSRPDTALFTAGAATWTGPRDGESR